MRSEEQAGTALDLKGFELVFDEEFDQLDVSAWGPNTRWIANTPWNGNFGDSIFTDPRPAFPFSVNNGILRIEARKDTRGKWRSGLLASVDRDEKGFLQQFGYFEIRAKLPEGKGLWPAFWLIGQGKSNYPAEIDVFEHYGHHPDRFESTVHVWNHDEPRNNRSASHVTVVPTGSLYDRFNTFGVLIDCKWIRIYFNRALVWQTPTPAQHRQPMYVLLNLAMGPGWPIDETPNPSFMFVDYVKVWGLKKNDVLGSK
jgi:beta-glucanase (GH16 family)